SSPVWALPDSRGHSGRIEQQVVVWTPVDLLSTCQALSFRSPGCSAAILGAAGQRRYAAPDMSDTLPTLSEVSAEPTRVIGRYRLIQRVGEGAFAEVYFARDEETLAPVAVKVLRDDIDASIREQVRVRFLAEEKITRAIRHPYVVHIRETSPADARPCFLAMDFVAGRPFSQHLARLRQG